MSSLVLETMRSQVQILLPRPFNMANVENDTPNGGTGEILSPATTENRKGAGGTFTHKLGCQCYPCKARARLQETVIGSTGAGGQALAASSASKEEPLNADALFIASPKGSRRPSLAKKSIIAEWIKLRSLDESITNTEVARQIGINRSYLQNVIQQGVKEGWLVFDDPLARLEYQVIPKAVENINAFLDAKDKQVTIEVAKGTLFKAFQESKGIHQGSTTVLALKIELPTTGNAQSEVIEGQIVGAPKVLVAAKEP